MDDTIVINYIGDSIIPLRDRKKHPIIFIEVGRKHIGAFDLEELIVCLQSLKKYQTLRLCSVGIGENPS